jgi:DMSO/TMAO reductase YedYZ molybdopterin-dependent catalytic subunit
MTEQQSPEMKFNVHVHGLVNRPLSLSYTDFTEGTLGASVDVHPIVPAFEGNATRVIALLDLVHPLPDCTHVVFHASDEFQATLPLGDLQDALLLFQQETGLPLKKGFPIRLLVPNGSSDCLNVKSVVEIDFIKHTHPDEEASFGFTNIVAAENL